MERRLTVHARATCRQAVRLCFGIGVLLASTSIASAAPKGKAAKAAFDRGVTAYQANDFAGASQALGESYKLEADIETLFAWAQAERQQNNCDNAIDLYNKLLATDMPAENKQVVQAKLDECKAIVAAKTGVLDTPLEPPPPPEVTPPPEQVDKPTSPSHGTPWWKDPIGDVLTGAGIVSLGVGAYFLVSARSAEQRSLENYTNFEDEQAKAASRGKIGVITTIAGGALLVGGIVRYVTRSKGTERTQVTGWVTPDGRGGLAAFGRF